MGSATRARHGFSLIELLIVIGIIGVLVAIAVAVGTTVTAGARARSTQDVIRVLEQTRDTWMQDSGEMIPDVIEIANGVNTFVRQYPIDARAAASGNWTGDATPSVTIYTSIVMQNASVGSMLEGQDPRFFKGSRVPGPVNGEAEAWSIPAMEVVDAWGRPIRFVHPSYDGGFGDYWNAKDKKLESGRELLLVGSGKKGDPTVEFRRSWRPWDEKGEGAKVTSKWVGDADEGICPGGTPYFYSAGEDADPGTRSNNVYSVQPEFPAETRAFLD